MASEAPVNSVDVAGVGGATRTLFGYQIDHLLVPLANGDTLALDDAIVYVPEAGALPADLPGIFGMNQLGRSFSTIDLLTGLRGITKSCGRL